MRVHISNSMLKELILLKFHNVWLPSKRIQQRSTAKMSFWSMIDAQFEEKKNARNAEQLFRAERARNT